MVTSVSHLVVTMASNRLGATWVAFDPQHPQRRQKLASAAHISLDMRVADTPLGNRTQ